MKREKGRKKVEKHRRNMTRKEEKKNLKRRRKLYAKNEKQKMKRKQIYQEQKDMLKENYDKGRE